MQGQHESAVSSDSVESGITSNEFYDDSFTRMHGDAEARIDIPRRRYEPGPQFAVLPTLAPHEKCEDENCARCTTSTSGENFEQPLRASTVYNGEGHLRLVEPEANDPRIADGNPDEAIDAIDSAKHDPDTCTIEKCRRCSTVDDRMLQKEAKMDIAGGGNGTGRAKEGISRHQCGCGMFNCEHLAEGGRHAGGRRAKGPRSRSTPHSMKLSEEGKRGLKTPGATELVDELGFAIEQGNLTVADARRLLGVDEAA